jgi:transcriptional repressor NrdR
VGLAILGPLRELDEVAYLRFASVYRSFDSLSDFEREIAMLRSTTTESVVPPEDSDQGETKDAQPSLANGRWQH